ncbi:hypothetical protein PLICRDRAFT_35049 [Plicaturopsis crispa FD-325 SS-3]|nr:hypothetical protein PLICRDRAFT_35049 [Plicaturopsis crispa FD-325 SS-3]
MLPKVATHILHQTTRAAAAVQSQTHAIRNVLQLQSSGPSSSSGTIGGWNGAGSSSWGSNGTGPGGAKYNAGSRYYAGYTGPGRAVTHANASTSTDGTSGQTDENDELAVRHPATRVKKTRSRSHSLSMGVQDRAERGEKLGVLQTIQMHARSRHAFATTSADRTSPPVLVRRNSTSVPLTAAPVDALPPPPPPASPPPPATDESLWVWNALKEARDKRDGAKVIKAVDALRDVVQQPRVADYNMAIDALLQTRPPGQPLTSVLSTYNEMVQRGVLPNSKTYTYLIYALTDRDAEVHNVLTTIEARSHRRIIPGEMGNDPNGRNRAQQLRKENNFASAMALFEALAALSNARIPTTLYHSLLKSCAIHAHVGAAINVFAHLEQRKDVAPDPAVYYHLLSAHVNAGDLEGAVQVFEEYKSACKAGQVSVELHGQKGDLSSPAVAHLNVWNKTVEAYFRWGQSENGIALLQEMMDSKADGNFDIKEAPFPASSTYTTIIGGFCQAGDVDTALTWFYRLLEQDTVARNPYEGSPRTPRPDQVGWAVMFDALASSGKVHELNRLFEVLESCAPRDGLEIRHTDLLTAFCANIDYVRSDGVDDQQAVEHLDWLVDHVLVTKFRRVFNKGSRHFAPILVDSYISRNAQDKAIEVAEACLEFHSQNTVGLTPTSDAEFAALRASSSLHRLRVVLGALIPRILQRVTTPQGLSFENVMRIVRLADKARTSISRSKMPLVMHSYGLARAANAIPTLSLHDWELLACAASRLELPATAEDEEYEPMPKYAFGGLMALLEDFAALGVPLNKMDPEVVNLVLRGLLSNLSVEELQRSLEKLGPDFAAVLGDPSQDVETLTARLRERGIDPQTVSSIPAVIRIRVDLIQSRWVDEYFPQHRTITPHICFQRFMAGVEKNVYPFPATLGRLINALGRLGELDKVHILYDAAQTVLSNAEHSKAEQAAGWFLIEDQMIIANAHGGHMDAALLHRQRILEQGGIPTADAYGALIQNVKDTTDDTSNAMSLFNEALAEGVHPNIFLYNTIISKLSKARKVAPALELFQQMKASNIIPSSITYGAVIAACARVGDAQSAEVLFQEMTSQKNFRPRVPPYNTMMQLYAHTKPDRERVMFYFAALQQAGIRPSAHSYKLMMDAYGTIEPVDVESMENIHQRVCADGIVAGGHWASLINAWGCVKKDLDKAIEIFESVETHPSTARSQANLPDAITFEALFNVIVTHHRADLLSHYLQRLQSSNVRMTAYIANQIIKGYATGGELQKARDFFEKLADPPSGVAASNNHVPHENSPAPDVPASAPVYREPSTWEAMVRGELGSGHRDNAMVLLERMKARQFPPAVYNRISGIMLDDSVSPWPSTDSPTSNDF